MEKKCPCADPPGGEITCSEDQLGICGIIDGKLVVGCFDPPSSVSRIVVYAVKLNAIDNWVLSRVTGVSRTESQPISFRERQILQQGQYVHPTTGDTVKFSMPRREEEPIPQATPMTQYR